MSRAKPWVRQKMQAGALVLNDKSHSNYSPDGVFGDPTLATKEKGELLLKAMIEDIRELISAKGASD
jgi:creatinine amidohydrolase/Fe(II)-dependent formamide hydrolase-like protein